MEGSLGREEKTPPQQSHLAANISKAHDANNFSRQFTAFVLLTVPLALLKTTQRGQELRQASALPLLSAEIESNHAPYLHSNTSLRNVSRQAKDVGHR